jgi:hypothetical protein
MKAILFAALIALTSAKESVDSELALADTLGRVAGDKPAAAPAAPAEVDAGAEASAEPIKNEDKLHFFNFDNAKMLWSNDWELYRKEHGGDGEENNCRLAESDNWLGA